jgi:ELWxxDGT repeat protein
MYLAHWVKKWLHRYRPHVRVGRPSPVCSHCRPQVEALEDRTVMSGTPTLVADIFPGAAGSYPQGLVGLNGNIYFVASDGPTSDLWKSDGTAAGTVKVKQFTLDGAGGALPDLVNVCGRLYFSASNQGSFQGLWTSDGTAAGTRVLKELYSQSGIQADGKLFFVASDELRGSELWKSNGTAAGTVLVKDIYSGTTYSGNPNSSQPRYLTDHQGKVFFSAYDGLHGNELWMTDGTAVGTVLVKDIAPTTETYTYSSNPHQFTSVNGILFFTATTPDLGEELWKTDGTAAGTVLVKDIDIDDDRESLHEKGSHPIFLTNVNGTLFFTADDGVHGRELWKSDGTPEGTILVKDTESGNDWRKFGPQLMTDVNGTLYFVTEDFYRVEGQRLWKSDGTPEGTVVIEPAGTRFGVIEELLDVNGTLYFSTSSPDGNAIVLWKTDGTPGGAVELGTLRTGNASSRSFQFTVVGSKLYFIGNDGASPDGHGYELWSIDVEEGPESDHDCGCGNGRESAQPPADQVDPSVVKLLTGNEVPAPGPAAPFQPAQSGTSSIPETAAPPPL